MPFCCKDEVEDDVCHWKKGKNVGSKGMSQISCADADVCGQGETSLGVHSKGGGNDCTDTFEASPDSIKRPHMPKSMDTPRALCCKASALSVVSVIYTTRIRLSTVVLSVTEEKKYLTEHGLAHAKLASAYRVSTWRLPTAQVEDTSTRLTGNHRNIFPEPGPESNTEEFRLSVNTDLAGEQASQEVDENGFAWVIMSGTRVFSHLSSPDTSTFQNTNSRSLGGRTLTGKLPSPR